MWLKRFGGSYLNANPAVIKKKTGCSFYAPFNSFKKVFLWWIFPAIWRIQRQRIVVNQLWVACVLRCLAGSKAETAEQGGDGRAKKSFGVWPTSKASWKLSWLTAGMLGKVRTQLHIDRVIGLYTQPFPKMKGCNPLTLSMCSWVECWGCQGLTNFVTQESFVGAWQVTMPKNFSLFGACLGQSAVSYAR